MWATVKKVEINEKGYIKALKGSGRAKDFQKEKVEISRVSRNHEGFYDVDELF